MTIGTKKPHMLANPNIKRKKSYKKYYNLISHYKMLLKREKEGVDLKWVKNAKAMAEARMIRYGIKKEEIST